MRSKVLTEHLFCVILYPNKSFENIYTDIYKTEVKMKRIGLALSVFALIWMGVSALHLTNPYLRSSEFIEVSVSRGENVWTIARRFATKETMVEQLEEAIIEVNGLAPDGAVAAGRRLRVPVIEPTEHLQAMAEHKALDMAARAPYNDVTD